MQVSIRTALLAAGFAALTGCGEFPTRDGGPTESMDLSNVPDAVPRWEPPSRYGNPETYTVDGRTYTVMKDAAGYVEEGLASWYGTKFHGQYTSTREVYNMYSMTAAHKTLPLPTYARVTNLQNGRSVVVRINDRGPFHDDRIIDLSFAAASRLGVVATGTARVEVRALDPSAPMDAPQPPPAPAGAVVTAATGFRADEPGAATPLPAAGTVPPANSPASATTGNLYVQVAAFSKRENAERLRLRLNESDKLNATVVETSHPTRGPLFLVRVGPISDQAEAERLSARLEKLGVGKPRLVRN